MVKKCCVSMCRSNCYKDCGINFFRVPPYNPMRQRWIDAIPGNVRSYSVVCHLHFRPEDIVATSMRPKLKKDAIPRLFYNYSKAKDTVKLLTPEQLKYILERNPKDDETLNTTRDTEDDDDEEDDRRSNSLEKENTSNNPSASESVPATISVSDVNNKKIETLKWQVKMLKQRLHRRDNKIKDLRTKLKRFKSRKIKRKKKLDDIDILIVE